jgi:hypothetical protein
MAEAAAKRSTEVTARHDRTARLIVMAESST